MRGISLCFGTGECIRTPRKPETVIRGWINRKGLDIGDNVPVVVYRDGIATESFRIRGGEVIKCDINPETSFILDTGVVVKGISPYEAAKKAAANFPVGSRLTLFDETEKKVFVYRVLAKAKDMVTKTLRDCTVIFSDSYVIS